MAQMRQQAAEQLWDEVTKDALRRGRIRRNLIKPLRKSIRRLMLVMGVVLATAALLLVVSALTSDRSALEPFTTLAAAATDDGDKSDALSSWGRGECEGVRNMFNSAYGGLTSWGQDPDRPAATPTPTRGSAEWVAALEQQIHQLVNQNRQSPLVFDVALASVARSHSADMANSNYFSHINQQGQSPSDRGEAVGYDCRKDYGSYYTYGLPENINQAWLYSQSWTLNGILVRKDYYELEELASLVVDGWIASTGHRENILNNSYDVEGIGVAINDDEKVYLTQNFC